MPFVEKGKDAGYFGGDLLNVIGRRAVAMKRYRNVTVEDVDKDVYGRMLAVYRKNGNREAELLVMLDSVGHVVRVSNEGVAEYDPEDVERREREVLQTETYKTYERMLARFGDLPLAAEIYLRMLDLEVSPRLKVQWIEESYERYKAYPRAKELLNRRETLEAPAMSFLLGSSVNSDMGYTARVEHRNVSGVELSWYLMPEGEPEWEKVETKYRRDRLSYVKRYGRLQKTEHLTWKAYAPYESVTDTFDLSVPGVGYYMIVAKAERTKNAASFPNCKG